MIIYMDNFRGFKNTHLTLEDVNFLVGENSTGKSSVLGLINLFSDYGFWVNNTFNTDDVKFGHFDDIVSIYSSNRSYFKIGICGKHFSNEMQTPNFPPNIAHLFVYTEHEGSPRLSEYFYFDGSYETHVIFKQEKDGQIILYSINKRRDIKNNENIFNKVFLPWTRRKIGSKHQGYELVEHNYMFRRRESYINLPVQLILSYIDQKLLKETNREEELEWFNPSAFSEFIWLAPIRTKPRRTYDEYQYAFTPEGEHTPYVVRKILHSRKDRANFINFLKKVGKSSGLFDTVSIKKYGDSSISPFELDVTLNKKLLSINNVGYGVSQILPIIVEIFSRNKHSRYAIQQPEVHLHPRAQAAIGTVIFEFAKNENKQFLIETHSDYLIDRYRISVRKNKARTNPRAQVIYFERSSKGNKLHKLAIDENGDLPSEQPKGYRNFFIKEEFNLLGID